MDKPPRRKPGPKPKEGPKHTARLEMKLLEADLAELTEAAAAVDSPVTTYIRDRALAAARSEAAIRRILTAPKAARRERARKP